MMETEILVSLSSFLLGLMLGVFCFYVYRNIGRKKRRREVDKEVRRVLNKARSQSLKLQEEAKKRSKNFELRARKNAEKEIFRTKQKLRQEEQNLKIRGMKIEKEHKRKEEKFLERQNELKSREEYSRLIESRMKEAEKKIQSRVFELQSRLETVSAMSAEVAKKELKGLLKGDAEKEAREELVRIEENIKKKARQRAKEVISVALSRYASEVATERTVSIISLPGDEMKGKIIGREGRNIRALEASCGVDIIVDETPGSVIISCFDPVRREVARQTLQNLIEDGRVHPARIEEVVEQVKKDLNKKIKEDGEKVCLELGLHGVHPALMRSIGLLKYRQIENKNLYKYSLEVAYLAGMLAEELSYNVKEARRAGVFCTIGCTIDHTVEGSYAKVGADYLKKHGEKESIVQAVRAHNGEVQANDVLVYIVQASCKIALTHQGAKDSMTQKFIRRLEDLESIGNSFDGVLRTFAVQAGKEIHVLVDSAKITDDQANMLSRDIARKIESELNYTGQVNIKVIREIRVIEHAR